MPGLMAGHFLGNTIETVISSSRLYGIQYITLNFICQGGLNHAQSVNY